MKIINFPRALLFFVQLFQEAEEKQTTSVVKEKERDKNVSINVLAFASGVSLNFIFIV